MEQAILPFLLYLILQVLVFTVGVVFVKTEFNMSGIIHTYVVGQLAVMALVEILAVPMILLRWRFDVLFSSFLVFFLLLVAWGIRCFSICLKEREIHECNIRKDRNISSVVFLVIAVLLVLFQFIVYFFGMHLDEDDARWLAEANDALTYGDMIIRNYYTGEYAGEIVYLKDATSPWPMMFAIVSRILLNTRVSIVAHTVYASFEVLVMYGVYYLLGCELFKKKEARYVFLLMIAVINMFFAGARHTQSVFSLNRIWQGKATVASVIIPFLLYVFVRINRRNERKDWLVLPIVSCAACLMSGMGISLSVIIISVYGIYHIIAYKHWKRIPYFVVSILPSLVFAVTYFCLKG